MLGSKPRGQSELLIAGPLRDSIPDDHVLARVDKVPDLSWLRAEVRDCYAADGAGRPGIDPEAALRLRLAGFLLGIVHDRRLMREAQVNLAILWFAGFGLADILPDRSSLTRIRQRWGGRTVPRHVRPHRAGVHGRRDRAWRGGTYRRRADPGRRILGEPPGQARRCGDGSGRR